MKPIKPKKMSKRYESWLRDFAAQPHDECIVESKVARAIIAALEYERQRADKAEKDVRDLLESPYPGAHVPTGDV